MSNTLEELVAGSYEKLLDFALTHQGDADAARTPQLTAERDAARRQLKTLEGVRGDLEKTQNILNAERQEHQKLVEEHAASKTRVAQLEDTVKTMARDLQTKAATITELENRPVVHPDWEDIDRFVTQAIDNFESDPGKSYQALTRLQIALQGKEPAEVDG